jgi:hypothetical protein
MGRYGPGCHCLGLGYGLMEPAEPDSPAQPNAIIDERVRYHEAGHAVAYWHCDVSLQFVSTSPSAGGHRGETSKVDRELGTGVTELQNEMICTAAGEIAEKRLPTGPRLPSAHELGRRFETYPARVRTQPGLVAEDEGLFVEFGQARDGVIHDTNADVPTGPPGWLQVWEQAEQLIEKLWPAVSAVARALEDARTLSGDEVFAIAAAATRKQA